MKITIEIPDEAISAIAKQIAEDMLAMQKQEEEQSRQLRGLKGIMEIFKCSKSKAFLLKESGRLDAAITQVSPRIFFTDEKKALQIMNHYN